MTLQYLKRGCRKDVERLFSRVCTGLWHDIGLTQAGAGFDSRRVVDTWLVSCLLQGRKPEDIEGVR